MYWANVDLNSLLPESGRSEFEVDVSKWTHFATLWLLPKPADKSQEAGPLATYTSPLRASAPKTTSSEDPQVLLLWMLGGPLQIVLICLRNNNVDPWKFQVE